MTHRPRFVIVTSLLPTGPATAKQAVLISYGIEKVERVRGADEDGSDYAIKIGAELLHQYVQVHASVSWQRFS